MKYDCESCGACCVSPFDGEGYIALHDSEESHLVRFGLPVLEIIAEPAQDRVVLLGTRINSDRVRVCAALYGKIGTRCACVIYADRPKYCRQFEAGSPECLAAREATGFVEQVVNLSSQPSENGFSYKSANGGCGEDAQKP